MLTLGATTMSIALTFGTAAVIDYTKKQNDKHEIVMMVMNDMQQSLSMINTCDSNLHAFFDKQVDIIAHPEKLDGEGMLLVNHFPILNYTTTTENIFRSNIETINTIGNVVFVENVSSFYDIREKYSKEVCDSFLNETYGLLASYDKLATFDASDFLWLSQSILETMEDLFVQCKMLMDVSDADLQTFADERRRLKEATTDTTIQAKHRQAMLDTEDRIQRLQKAREQGKRQLGRK